MVQIKENLPLFVYFLIQFSDWEVKAAQDFDMPNSFQVIGKIGLTGEAKPPHLGKLDFIVMVPIPVPT